ncbi:hypothetical protein [Bacillus thuringiensis]|uniref:hypothetical protein n=1 Tax=Bacillus thuringiensis TaxID=1428 RepID=UPI0018CE9CD2|nr:hypothetical protein [Bacillus thuringiensis]
MGNYQFLKLMGMYGDPSKKKIAIFEGENSEKKLKKPRNRKERVEFLIKKMGFDVIGS